MKAGCIQYLTQGVLMQSKCSEFTLIVGVKPAEDMHAKHL